MNETWEERMAERAATRRSVEVDTARDEMLAAAIEAGKKNTREKAEQDRIDYCADCCEVFLDRVHGWRTRLTCGGPGRSQCVHEHAHHDDEIWLAGAPREETKT